MFILYLEYMHLHVLDIFSHIKTSVAFSEGKYERLVLLQYALF